ncbi:hypothetical protein [Desulfopila inferna]|uniref:hypothetical protein n=1 Tax=Desulfopila inferna TaxID=468528 RepID=UPI0019649C7F|nr:hypothetical protein [Desulfopila inferna]MBM9602684.1 hypothetical protein [Desulfopila inferna]
MNTQSSTENRIIVVLGAGRTGTSLLTRILNILGMSLSEKEVPLSEQNPAGFFEDAEIVEIQKNFLSKLSCHPYLPFPVDFLKNQNISSFHNDVHSIVFKNINKTSTIWGFKDPRTPNLLPIWTRVFNKYKIVPKYVLTVRNPQSTVVSLHKQYGDSPQIAELTWLHRNCEALYHTGGNCFIVHYEDWFSEKAAMIGSQLLQYTGLAEYWGNERSVSDAMNDCVKPQLNRAVYNDYEIKNRYVIKLYSVLQNCHGDSFDRRKLMDVVVECRKAMAEFSGWPMMAQQFYRQQNRSVNQKTKKKLEAVEPKLQKSYEEKVQYVGDIQKYIIECKDLSDQNEHLRIRLSVKAKELQDTQRKLEAIEPELDRNRKELFTLKTSTSFKVGLILVKAVVKPGKNTLLFPLYLLRVLLASRAVKN